MSDKISLNTIKPFVIASLDKDTLVLLKFLFMPPSLFRLAPEIPEPLVLPELIGEINNNEYTSTSKIIKSTSTYEFAEFIKSLIDFMTSKVIDPLIKREITPYEVASKIMENQKELSNIFFRYGIPLLNAFRGGIAIEIVNYIIDKWSKLITVEPEYPQILHLLKKFNLIKPFIQVIICPYCGLTSLHISEYPIEVNSCPRCGKKPIVGILYTLNQDLAQLKLEYNDIPYFIKAYLLYKSIEKLNLSEPNIKINHKVKFRDPNNPQNNAKAEIDVYIKDLKYGIECKEKDVIVFITEKQLSNWLNELKEQVKRYQDSGVVSRLLIITNLKENEAKRIEQELKSQALKITLEGVLWADPEILIKKLDEIAEQLKDKDNEKIQRKMVKDEMNKAKRNDSTTYL